MMQKLELVGNTSLHLTIVDLPGLISVSENEHDMQLVSDLVSYLRLFQQVVTLILKALSNEPVATIKYGVRMLGIITKPDLINAGAEQWIAHLAKNMDRTNLTILTHMQCSGTMPCARCITEKCDCIYNPQGDCISKAYIADLLAFHAALCRIITTLRSGSSDEISWLMWETQSQETVRFVAYTHSYSMEGGSTEPERTIHLLIQTVQDPLHVYTSLASRRLGSQVSDTIAAGAI
jgi:hypothetical protein